MTKPDDVQMKLRIPAEIHQRLTLTAAINYRSLGKKEHPALEAFRRGRGRKAKGFSGPEVGGVSHSLPDTHKREIDWIWWVAVVGGALMGVGGHWSPLANDGLFAVGLVLVAPLLIQWPRRMGL